MLIDELKKDERQKVQEIGFLFRDFNPREDGQKGKIYSDLINRGFRMPIFDDSCVTIGAMRRAYFPNVKSLRIESCIGIPIGMTIALLRSVEHVYTFLLNYIFRTRQEFLMFDKTPRQEYVELLLINFDPDNEMKLYRLTECGKGTEFSRIKKQQTLITPEAQRNLDVWNDKFESLPNLKSDKNSALNEIYGTMFQQLQLLRRTKIICKKRRRYHHKYLQIDKAFTRKYKLESCENLILGSTMETFQKKWTEFTMHGLAGKPAVKMYQWMRKYQFQVAKYQFEKLRAVALGDSIEGLDFYQYYVENGIEATVILRDQIADDSLSIQQIQQLEVVKKYETQIFLDRKKNKIKHLTQYIKNIQKDENWFKSRILQFETVYPKLHTLLKNYKDAKTMVDLLSIFPHELKVLQNISVLVGADKRSRKGFHTAMKKISRNFLGESSISIDIAAIRLKRRTTGLDDAPSMIFDNINDGSGVYGRQGRVQDGDENNVEFEEEYPDDNDPADQITPEEQRAMEQMVLMKQNQLMAEMKKNVTELASLSSCEYSGKEQPFLNNFTTKDQQDFSRRLKRRTMKQRQDSKKNIASAMQKHTNKVRKLKQADITNVNIPQLNTEIKEDKCFEIEDDRYCEIKNGKCIELVDVSSEKNETSDQDNQPQIVKKLTHREMVWNALKGGGLKGATKELLETTTNNIVKKHKPEVIDLVLNSMFITMFDLTNLDGTEDKQAQQLRVQAIQDTKFDFNRSVNRTAQFFSKATKSVLSTIVSPIINQYVEFSDLAWVGMRFDKASKTISYPLIAFTKNNECETFYEYLQLFIGFVELQPGFGKTIDEQSIMSVKMFDDMKNRGLGDTGTIKKMRITILKKYYNIFITIPPFGHALVCLVFKELEKQIADMCTHEGRFSIWRCPKKDKWLKLFGIQAKQVLIAWKRLICNFSLIAGIPYLAIMDLKSQELGNIIPKWDFQNNVNDDSVPIFTQDSTTISKKTNFSSKNVIVNKPHSVYSKVKFSRQNVVLGRRVQFNFTNV